jgi:DNA-binding MarR family transcriptional regulator
LSLVRHTAGEVGLLIKRLQHRHHVACTAALADLGISLVQWDTLRHLHLNPGASLHDLAQLTFQTDQSFGSLATRMAAAGLIERVEGPGRAVRHRLTERGEALRVSGQGRVDGVLANSLGRLESTDLEALGDVLERALAHTPPAATERVPNGSALTA